MADTDEIAALRQEVARLKGRLAMAMRFERLTVVISRLHLDPDRSDGWYVWRHPSPGESSAGDRLKPSGEWVADMRGVVRAAEFAFSTADAAFAALDAARKGKER